MAIIPLGYALLGLLARAPQSGYELIQHMEEPIAFFWHARRSQIYPELERLESVGLVSYTVVLQHNRPSKKVYSISQAGLAELRTWAGKPMDIPPDRDEFMLKVYSLWTVDPSEVAAMIRAYAESHAQRLDQYERIEVEMRHKGDPVVEGVRSPRFAAYATLQRGIEYERGYVAWCQWLLQALESGGDAEI
jgi:DNA-binding PadR family transcriptional regulator